MNVIDDFINTYAKEHDFYDRVARLAAHKLDAELQEAGIRSIVTSRAKSVARLKAKCGQREEQSGKRYSSVEEIYSDIVDLAGVRVALYFPGEIAQVGGIVNSLFDQVVPRKRFPNLTRARNGNRFSGYSAVHYLIQIKEHDLSEPQKSYAKVQIELQVASILMHAWSEVEHDLVYKPLAGDLSSDEYAILDQLNGLVIAGEISLEMLQRAAEARVAARGRKIANHYELAAYLLSVGEDMIGESIGDAGLGHVDVLFELVAALAIDTPDLLSPYLEALRGNLEVRRPLAEQIIDAVLAYDADRYEIYRTIWERRSYPRFGSGHDEIVSLVRFFITAWTRLEITVQELAPEAVRGMPILANAQRLMKSGIIDGGTMGEIDQLHRMRNSVIHSTKTPGAADLKEATRRIDVIENKIRLHADEFDNTDSL
jgi:ppGpp synthetase/RelA/SpoT-type nucleotidyltranferase